MYKKCVKRIGDVILSGLALVILSPVYLALAILIKCDSKGPVIFKQKRVGKNKEYFYIYKYRSMQVDTPQDSPTHLLQDSNKYITKMGSILRKTSLDELPQILNIFKGEMSIIGPRPALWNQEDLIAARDENGANLISPGLTGYAQINGRDELPIPVKAGYDGYYVKNISFKLDVRIFFTTITKVFKRSDVVEGQTESPDTKSHSTSHK